MWESVPEPIHLKILAIIDRYEGRRGEKKRGEERGGEEGEVRGEGRRERGRERMGGEMWESVPEPIHLKILAIIDRYEGRRGEKKRGEEGEGE